MSIRFSHYYGLLFAIILLFSDAGSVNAQTISTVQELDFGYVVDRGGNRTRIFANPDGSFSTNNDGVVFITNPRPAEIEISGAVGFSSYTVDKTTPRRADITGPGVTARINNFLFSSPDGFAIDGAGNGSFFMGARLNTRRVSNAPYPEAVFNGDIEIEVTFIP